MTHAGPAGPELVPVEKHQLDTLAAIRPLRPLWLSLDEAEGGVLAEDVLADTPLPPFDNSAMDGYAVPAADLQAGAVATRHRLPVDPDAVLARLEQLLPEADLLVTSGVVSMGG